MSQGFHQGIFSFSDGFDRSSSQEQENRPGREKQAVVLQGVGFNEHPLVTIEEEEEAAAGDIYHQAAGRNMLSEMFNFPGQGVAASELLAYHTRPAAAAAAGFSGGGAGGTTDHLNHWYGSSTNRQGRMVLGSSSSTNLSSLAAGDHDDDQHQQQQLMPGLNTTNPAAAAMQLFLMNPTRSPPPPPPHDHPANNSSLQLNHLIHTSTSSFGDAPSFGGVVEAQGLSLSLASSLQQPYEMAKVDQELRLRDGVLYFNQSQQQQQQQHHHQPASVVHLHDHGHGQQHISQGQQMGGAYGSMGVVNVLRNSRYSRAAQELLEEFCSVGRGQVLKSSRRNQQLHSNTNPIGGGASADPPTSSSTKDLPPLSSSDKFEHQRKKAKLLSMLDEVDRRYHQYCEQMQMVVNSFDSVMGFGAATPYTALAQKAMSRHFRCLKDAVAAQLKQTCEVLGEKDAGGGSSSGGITKGETPRLRVLDQTLRQQRAFHQMGMMDQEAWRPQRGLPERSVTILRAWLFEHFLHPYPSDADKHLLARQTGLSRNQVSNWFINARVRLWKPMVEEMYQQEAKDKEEEAEEEEDHLEAEMSETTEQQQHHQITESPTHHDQQSSDHHHHHQRFAISSSMTYHHHIQAAAGCSELSRSSADQTGGIFIATPELICNIPTAPPTTDHNIYDHSTDYEAAKAHITFARAAADHVSLTLGLRHAGNAPDHNTRFTVRDFGDNH